jgi:hypothetical protein
MLFKGSLEDIIYIVIGLIWLVFSIYKGAQKSKAKKQVSPESEPQPEPEEKKTESVFNRFLENLMKEEESVPYEKVELTPEENSYDADAVKDSEKVFSYDDQFEESNVFERTNVYEEEPSKQTTLNQELKTHLKRSRKKPRFDLRKAVIYSEILNRRYF